jgi:hypothetical protein
MSNGKRELALEQVLPLLNERERAALAFWRGSDQAALAPSLNAKLFQLFLQGKGTEEIRRLNPQLSLGQIVAARVEGEWDARRKEHLDDLLNETSTRVKQVTMETADFVCDLLAVANREHGDKLRRYLQTGDAKELNGLRVESFSDLKNAIAALQALTGQDKQKKLSISGEIIHSEASEKKTPTAEQASAVLRLLTAVQ